MMSDLQFSLERNLVHDHLDQGRFTFSILTDKSYFFSPLDIQLNTFQYHMITISFRQLLTRQDNFSRPDSRLEPHCNTGHIFFLDLYPLQFFQLFDPRLHLNGFCRLISETLYKIFCILNLLLLVLISPHLLFDPFFMQLLELRISHFIIIHFPQRNLKRPGGHIIQKSTVMRHQDYSPGISLQKRFQPGNRFYIQMIGRLIE